MVIAEKTRSDRNQQLSRGTCIAAKFVFLSIRCHGKDKPNFVPKFLHDDQSYVRAIVKKSRCPDAVI